MASTASSADPSPDGGFVVGFGFAVVVVGWGFGAVVVGFGLVVVVVVVVVVVGATVDDGVGDWGEGGEATVVLVS